MVIDVLPGRRMAAAYLWRQASAIAEGEVNRKRRAGARRFVALQRGE
jgi:hypothetical protein